ncbi:GntR family transcriptional regulator [Kosmotoga pacifica]|uniref:GntR family transcriptional regulator n=1 Tax=Kosmotoga pacifica TaxID=1330330 RepID=A0A0G2Z9P9_9BACT|nr:GntR family transcriptional regulator [Kosmotoga pacifica]
MSVRTEKEHGVPAYISIYRTLKARIEDGTYSKKLPTEKELCEEFEVSRLTVRRALDELKRERLLISKKGKGTFVTEKKREEQLSTLAGFTEEAISEGHTTKSLVLKNEIIFPPTEVMDAFGLPHKGMVVLLERVRFLDDQPMAIERSYLNPLVDIRVLNIIKMDMSNESLYRVLKEEFSIKLDHAVEIIEIAKLSEIEAKYLETNEGDYGILRHRLTYTSEGLCLEYVESIYRGDKYKLKVVRKSL